MSTPGEGAAMKREGGHAFPMMFASGVFQHGMTLRSFYKAAALQGLLAYYGSYREHNQPDKIGEMCGTYADALLAEDEAHAKK